MYKIRQIKIHRLHTDYLHHTNTQIYTQVDTNIDEESSHKLSIVLGLSMYTITRISLEYSSQDD